MIDRNKLLLNEVRDGDASGMTVVLGRWSDHYKSWKNINFAPILVVKYEDLIENSHKTFILILNFLKKLIDINIDEKKVLNTLNSCNFQNLQNMEKSQGFKEAVYSKDKKNKKRFFYLGKKNNWKDILDTEIEKKIRNFFSTEMKELGYF